MELEKQFLLLVFSEWTLSLSRQLSISNPFYCNNIWVTVAAMAFFKEERGLVVILSCVVTAAGMLGKSQGNSNCRKIPPPKAGRALCQMQALVRENRDEKYLHSSSYSRRSINFATRLIRNCDFKMKVLKLGKGGRKGGQDLIGFSFA